jgi:hypothetical protein
MKLTTLTAAFAAALALVQSASAWEYERREGVSAGIRHIAARRVTSRLFDSAAPTSAYGASIPRTSHAGYGRRPGAWCGWQMRQLVDSDPGPQFNLARNWMHWGHAGPPGIGAIVVWPHHVGKIIGQEGGMWIVQSGNDGGNRVRIRPRSLRGAVAIRWN